MHSFHVPGHGLGLEELVTLRAVHPRHGVLGRARPASVRQGHVGALGPHAGPHLGPSTFKCPQLV